MPYKDIAKEYFARRRFLIRILGGRCEECGTKEFLQFHHTIPRTWTARKLDRLTRMKHYYKEASLGILELLCCDCNKYAGKPMMRR